MGLQRQEAHGKTCAELLLRSYVGTSCQVVERAGGASSKARGEVCTYSPPELIRPSRISHKLRTVSGVKIPVISRGLRWIALRAPGRIDGLAAQTRPTIDRMTFQSDGVVTRAQWRKL